MKIQIDDIVIPDADMYLVEKYPNRGMYVVNNLLVVIVTTMVSFICNHSEIANLIETEAVDISEEKITEEFALKMLAISHGQKYKEVK